MAINCGECGAVIVHLLTDHETVDCICLDCSGALLSDFLNTGFFDSDESPLHFKMRAESREDKDR